MARPKKQARTVVLRLTAQEASDIVAALDFLVETGPSGDQQAARCETLSKHVEDTVVLARLAARRRKP